MLTVLRAKVNAAMLALSPVRRPALRRADSDDWLLCSDVAQLITEAAFQTLTERLTADGWRMQLQNEWLYLDLDVPCPQPSGTIVLTGEAACVQSLLMRHPDPIQDDRAVRALCKAAEQHPQKLALLCRRLHDDYAARLRRHEPLPGLLLPYLLQAHQSKEESP